MSGEMDYFRGNALYFNYPVMKAYIYSHKVLIGTTQFRQVFGSMGHIWGEFVPTNEYQSIKKQVQEFFDSLKRDYERWYSYRFNIQLENGYWLLPIGGVEIYDSAEFPVEPIEFHVAGVHYHVYEDYFENKRPFVIEPWQLINIDQKIDLEDELLREIGETNVTFSTLAKHSLNDEVLFAVHGAGPFVIANFKPGQKAAIEDIFPEENYFGEFDAVQEYMAKDNPKLTITLADRLGGCLAGGSIGDAIGSYYEGRSTVDIISLEVVNGITDDTQLTMATCESIIASKQVSAASIANHMLSWYNKGKLTGLGASTLKALRDLQAGAHWALSGRAGEYAAGNGAAMRIAPLAFFLNPETDRTLIRDVCNITHKNDEAYVGCLAILYSHHYIITNKWKRGISLVELLLPQLPDSAVRDNLLILADTSMSIREAASLVGTSGHVIESVPFSIFAAGKIRESSFEAVLTEIILCGGDTDTNASLAAQIMGTFIGLSKFSGTITDVFARINESAYILDTANKLSVILKEKTIFDN